MVGEVVEVGRLVPAGGESAALREIVIYVFAMIGLAATICGVIVMAATWWFGRKERR